MGVTVALMGVVVPEALRAMEMVWEGTLYGLEEHLVTGVDFMRLEGVDMKTSQRCALPAPPAHLAPRGLGRAWGTVRQRRRTGNRVLVRTNAHSPPAWSAAFSYANRELHV
jgi:hypothetical protein